jgi:hypothetical protein
MGACGTASTAAPVEEVAPRRLRTSGYEVREADLNEDSDPGRMGLRAERGSISQDDAEASIKQVWPRLVRCYDEAGEARQFAGGAVKLQFHVDEHGRATQVQVLESRLGNLEVERCLLAVGLTVAFPRPRGGARTLVEYSLEFRSTGEVPVVDLPQGELAQRFAAWLPRLAGECPDLSNDEVIATVYIGARGNVRSAGFASATSLAEETTTCLARALRHWAVRLDGGGGVRRVQLSLRKEDLAEARTALRPARPLNQGRRGGRR